MNPTENQIKLANAIAYEIRFFGNTNDLHSPSHYTLITESINELQEGYNLSDDNAVKLDEAINTILEVIKNTK